MIFSINICTCMPGIIMIILVLCIYFVKKIGWMKILAKKVWRMNRSAKRLLIVTIKFSLASQMADDLPNSPNSPASYTVASYIAILF